MEKAIFEIKIDKKGSERGDLIQFFSENIKDKNGDLYTIKRMAIKLSHLSKEDLYYMKSSYLDRLRRNGEETAGKWFNWSLKPQNLRN